MKLSLRKGRRGATESFPVRERHRDAIGLALVALCVGALLPAHSHAQVSVQPGILEFAADSVDTQIVRVTNRGEAPIEIGVRVEDFTQSEVGDHAFRAAATSAESCAGRIAVYPRGLAVAAGESRSVRVTMEPGEETCWSAVQLEVSGPATEGFRMRQRFAVKTYGVPAGAEQRGRIAALEAQAAADGAQVRLRFENTGQAPLRVQGRLELRTLEGEVVEERKLGTMSALPGHGRVVEVHLDGRLETGEYLVVPIFDYGADHLLGAQVIVEIP